MVGYSFYWLLAWYLLPALICLCHTAAESVNNKIQIKKMDAAPRLATPFANTAPNPPEPPRILQVTY